MHQPWNCLLKGGSHLKGDINFHWIMTLRETNVNLNWNYTSYVLSSFLFCALLYLGWIPQTIFMLVSKDRFSYSLSYMCSTTKLPRRSKRPTEECSQLRYGAQMLATCLTTMEHTILDMALWSTTPLYYHISSISLWGPAGGFGMELDNYYC